MTVRSAVMEHDRQRCRSVAKAWGGRLEAAGCPVFADTRRQPICAARQSLMLALWRERHSMPSIAAAIGLDNHTTILHGVRTARACAARRHLARILPEGDDAALVAAIAACDVAVRLAYHKTSDARRGGSPAGVVGRASVAKKEHR